jgi:hypothetical protein
MATTMARPKPEEIGTHGQQHCVHCQPEREIERVEKGGAPAWRHVDTQSMVCQVKAG